MVDDLRFFQLTYNPFHKPSPLNSLSLSLSQQHALHTMTEGIEQRQGFVMVIGEAGMGKTAVLTTYLESLDPQQYTTIRLSDSTISLREIFARLCRTFGFTVHTDALRAVTEHLRPLLQQTRAQNRYVVLVVDDAHHLTMQALWNLRMLSDLLSTPEGSLIQILLVGQPRLEHLLSLPELQSLQTRLTTRATIAPFTRDESRAYIAQHLDQAMTSDQAVFTPGALKRLINAAGGNPRRLDTLCAAALRAGVMLEQKPITAAMACQVLEELRPPRRSTWLRWGLVSAGALVLSLGLLGGWLYANRGVLPWDDWTPPTALIHSEHGDDKERPASPEAAPVPLASPKPDCRQQPHSPSCLKEATLSAPPEVPGKPEAAPAGSRSLPAHPLESQPQAPVTDEPVLPLSPPPQDWADTIGLTDTRVVCVTPRTAGERGKDIILMDYMGTQPRRIVADGSINLSPSLSPDGTTLAYTSYRDGAPNIYLRNLVTGKEEQLTTGPGVSLPGSWSPNGRYLALSQSSEGNSDIYLYDTVRQQLRRLTAHSGIDVSPHFAPDNTRIVFTSDRPGSPQLYLTDIDGRPPIRLTQTGMYNTSPAWSPHGETIAFIGRSAEGTLEIYTIQADGSNLQRLTQGRRLHKAVAWAPNGAFVMSLSLQGSTQARYLVRVDGQEERLLPTTGPVCQSPQWIAQHKR